jgi:hypothetical protein
MTCARGALQFNNASPRYDSSLEVMTMRSGCFPTYGTVVYRPFAGIGDEWTVTIRHFPPTPAPVRVVISDPAARSCGDGGRKYSLLVTICETLAIILRLCPMAAEQNLTEQ